MRRHTLILIPAVLAASAALGGCATIQSVGSTMSGQGSGPVATWLRAHQARGSLKSATWHALTGRGSGAPMRILDRWFRGRRVYWIAAVNGKLYRCDAGVTNRATCVRVSGWRRESSARTDARFSKQLERESVPPARRVGSEAHLAHEVQARELAELLYHPPLPRQGAAIVTLPRAAGVQPVILARWTRAGRVYYSAAVGGVLFRCAGPAHASCAVVHYRAQ